MDVFIICWARNEAPDSGWSPARRRGPGDGAEPSATVGVALVTSHLANAVFLCFFFKKVSVYYKEAGMVLTLATRTILPPVI